MKNIMNVLVLVLAINFLLVAGVVGWLFQSGKINREKAQALRELIFTEPKIELATEATEDEKSAATTRPILRLDQLISDKSGLTATQQLDFLQESFDRRTAQLDRRERELLDLKRQIDLAAEQIKKDREAITQRQTTLDAEQQQAAELATDKGFQDSLTLYTAMPAKQVKQVFMSLDDETVLRYLTAMPPRTAAKIIKEFKTPVELDRVQKVLEMMRLAGVNVEE